MIIKREAGIIINKIMYLLSECMYRDRDRVRVSVFASECVCERASIAYVMNIQSRSETNAGCDVKLLRGFCVLWKYIEMTRTFSCRYALKFKILQYLLYFIAEKYMTNPLNESRSIIKSAHRVCVSLALSLTPILLLSFTATNKITPKVLGTNREQCSSFWTILFLFWNKKKTQREESGIVLEKCYYLIVWISSDCREFRLHHCNNREFQENNGTNWPTNLLVLFRIAIITAFDTLTYFNCDFFFFSRCRLYLVEKFCISSTAHRFQAVIHPFTAEEEEMLQTCKMLIKSKLIKTSIYFRFQICIVLCNFFLQKFKPFLELETNFSLPHIFNWNYPLGIISKHQVIANEKQQQLT